MLLMIRRDDNERTDSHKPNKPYKPYHLIQDHNMQARRRKHGVDMLEETFQKV